MPALTLRLLGAPLLERNGAPVPVDTRKGIALLAYLAVTGQRSGRDTLAVLLWPEYDQTHARAALRSTLWALHKALGGPGLAADRETVGLDAAADMWLDVAEYHHHLEQCRTHGHAPDEVCPACLPGLSEAVSLYRDDFLAGFTLRDSPGFDEWRFFQAEGLRRELGSALERLVLGQSARGALEQAIAFARRWLALDVLHEPAHVALMRLYVQVGQRAAALRQYQDCARLLWQELGVAPHPATTQLHEAIRANRPFPPSAPSPAAAALPAMPTGNLAAHVPATPFLGREQELAEIGRLLGDPHCRLLTLVGPGGIGKTRLAWQATLEVARPANYSDGAYFVPLASVSSTVFLAPTIAKALAFTFCGREDPEAQLLNFLRPKNLMLTIDNFEHLPGGASLLVELLQAAPGLKIVVTSRERLNVSEEWILDVRGLRFPEAVERDDVEVESFSAVQLFLQSARRVHWGFVLSIPDKPCVARVCRLVEGMPLAIELAAAWIRVIPCEDIAREIEHGLDVLAIPLHGLPERHRSLRVVFDHSWERLTAEARSVMQKLSVFRGGFSRPAAEQVAGASLESLGVLVDHSFLRRTASGRFEIHELLRQYAEDRLREVPDEDHEACERHARYYAEMLAQLEASLKGERQPEALTAIGDDLENVRAIWRWAVAHQDAAAIGRSMESLYLFYVGRGHFHEGAAAFGRGAEALNGKEPQHLRAGVLARQGMLTGLLGQFEQADQLLRQGFSLLSDRVPDTRAALAFTLYALGTIAHRQGNYAEAASQLQDSLSLYRELGDLYGLATALNGLGNNASKWRGANGEAYDYYRESLILRREIGDRKGIAAAVNNLGTVANRLGDYQEARRLFQESILVCQDLGDQYSEALALNNMGWSAHCLGQHLEARRLYEASLDIREAVNDRFAIALVLNNLGLTALNLGEHAEAGQLLRRSLDMHNAIGNLPGTTDVLNNLGLLAAYLGQVLVSRGYFYQALQMAVELNMIPGILESLIGIAGLLSEEPGSGTVGPEQAAELASLVWHHPASEAELRSRAARLLNQLEMKLTPDLLAAARESGAARSLNETVSSLLPADATGLG